MRAGTHGAQEPAVDSSEVEAGLVAGAGGRIGDGGGAGSVDGPPRDSDVTLSHQHPASVVAANAMAPLNSRLRYLSNFIWSTSPLGLNSVLGW